MGDVSLEPLTLEEARRSPQWTEWKKAILAEIEALRANGTFTVVTPPAGAHVIGTTMNFRVKRHADGRVDRLRARICAQGFQEIYMIDFVDTYAPVARLISIRVFLAECNQSGIHIRQGDVPTAFVKANLREVIYVKQPKGFEEGEPGQVWLLHKALYGLKQAGREWYIELDEFLRSQGLVPTREDPCVHKHPAKLLVVLVYVDDILIGYKNEEDMRELMNALEVKYGIKDLGELSWFLGMHVTRDFERGVMKIDQEQYAIEVCERFTMDNCRPGETAMDQSVVLYPGDSEEELATRVPYKQAVGAPLYLSRVTRPDIAFAVNQVAAHAARPTVTHWHAVKKIVRYVWGTRSMALVYQRDVHAPRIKVYTDADWANNILDRKSISDVLPQVHGCTVHWSCKRQTVVAKSSTAAEFISCSMGVEEVIWI
ncbi:hypothetical protein PR002_g22645 [Phytophthora rubi]|nr:hypothetical protein PR002_g22645 [Phytophthora rubi]